MSWSKLTAEDARLMLAAHVHTGSTNVNFQMKGYCYGRNRDGTNVIRLDKTWDKLVLAARAICAIENPQDVAVVGTRIYATRAVLKFAKYTNAFPFAGRFTPGTFTNQIQKAFREPRLLVVNCPVSDKQAIYESRYVNIPVVALCDLNADLRHVDIAIPCNNRSAQSTGLIWWMLCREVLRMRGTISRDVQWDVMVDLFIYRQPEEIEEEQQANMSGAIAMPPGSATLGQMPYMDTDAQVPDMMMGTDPNIAGPLEDWGNPTADWGASTMTAGTFGAVGEPSNVPGMPGGVVGAPGIPAAVPPTGNFAPDDWSNMQDDWAANM